MAVMRMVAPDLNFGFAWEPESKRVWIIHGNGKPHEQIAYGVMSPELAQQLVNAWCAGYRSRKQEEDRTPGSRHYHMLAEHGAVGLKFQPGS